MTPVPEIDHLIGQVIANCHRSDARFAGAFSLCGLLLRLRDYFKWERGLRPWSSVDSAEVLNWIEVRERLWDGLDEDPAPLAWRGREIDPFDAEAINGDLAEYGLYYGAGYAAFLKPTFLLGRVEKRETIGGLDLIFLGEESARDLFTAPAQTHGRVILARRRPLAAFLWDTMLHGTGRRRRAMDQALIAFDLTRSELEKPAVRWEERFQRLLDAEMEVCARHELGEAFDLAFPRDIWASIVADHPHGRVELLARMVKDMLADAGENGRLRYIIQTRSRASLAIFQAQFDGLAARMFPEIGEAADRFLDDGDWEPVETVRRATLARAGEMAGELTALAQGPGGPDHMARRVEELYFEPLGL